MYKFNMTLKGSSIHEINFFLIYTVSGKLFTSSVLMRETERTTVESLLQFLRPLEIFMLIGFFRSGFSLGRIDS